MNQKIGLDTGAAHLEIARDFDQFLSLRISVRPFATDPKTEIQDLSEFIRLFVFEIIEIYVRSYIFHINYLSFISGASIRRSAYIRDKESKSFRI